MTRVIHTGDTHLGYQQYHSPERRRDFLEAFEQVVDDAVEAGVDAVVHAGDLFHDRRPELEDLIGALSALQRLADADVPFLAVVGNHESTHRGQWLDLFENMGLAVRLDDAPVVVGDTAFYGLDHVPKSRRDDLEYAFEPHDAAHAALVAHGLFTPFAHADWETETVLAESTVDFDAMLLGDNHAHDVTEVEGAWVTYCGSTERASASEETPRGYNLVTFDGEVDVRRRTLETRRFVYVTADLDESEGEARVLERVRQHDLEDAVVVVDIVGDGDPVTPAAVEETAREEGALVARVTDRRDLPDPEAGVEVSFADPDDAVRERVDELGLSPAARTVDETVRAAKVADSNVRESVRTEVEKRLGDPAAFTSAPDDGADETSTDGEDQTTDGGESADGEEPTGGEESTADGETASDARAGEDDGEATEPEAVAAADAAPEEPDSPSTDAEDEFDERTDASSPDPAASDGQASMEEFQ